MPAHSVVRAFTFGFAASAAAHRLSDVKAPAEHLIFWAKRAQFLNQKPMNARRWISNYSIVGSEISDRLPKKNSETPRLFDSL